ncbi:glycosyltransferase family 4 protein [Corynebacterium tapiri]
MERVGEYLAERGHEVIFRSSAHTDAPRKSVRNRVTYRRGGGKYGVYVTTWLELLAGRVGLGPLRGAEAIVDTQNGIPFFARLVAGVPTVLLTHHCHREQWPVASPVIARVGWWLESRVAPLVYRGAPYVTVSESSRADLEALGVSGARIIANGVDPLPELSPLAPDDGKTHLVTLSRLVPHKQVEHAIALLHQLPETVVLDVIGDGWWADQLRAFTEKQQLTERVRFHGQVSEDYKHALLSRASLHLMPSRKEGWGLAVIEAAQHGVATIGYAQAGGLRDSIEDGVTGVLVGDESELGPTVVGLLNDASRRQRLGEAARALSARFSWDETGAQFERLLRDLVHETPAS